MRVLNLYAGIGGNRKLWENVEVTAVEYDKEIAGIYQDFFPDDKVIVTDAHQFLVDNFRDFDFIWSSPPCPTHSRFNNLFMVQESKKPRFPDMKLYEEIILLKHWFKGKWVVENVKSYYEPLIKPFESGNHYFWSNFQIAKFKDEKRGIRTQTIEQQEKKRFDLSKFDVSKGLKKKMLNNCVLPELGKDVFDCAFKGKQTTL